MHGSAAGKFLRVCFVVLFGAMSLFHFPVMAFGGEAHGSHHAAAAHHGDHANHGHANHANPAAPAKCDGFSCFLMVEPTPNAGRLPHPILFSVMNVETADFLLGAIARPDLPPPRLQG